MPEPDIGGGTKAKTRLVCRTREESRFAELKFREAKANQQNPGATLISVRRLDAIKVPPKFYSSPVQEIFSPRSCHSQLHFSLTFANLSTMGLAEPKRKKKLVPANSGRTNWENVSAAPSVAFKLMSSMGWTPGKGLGEKLDGEKESLRYLIKDDLLGIGAKKEYGGGVWRGMGEVDDLYARLDVGGSTPKEEEIMNEEVEEVGRPLFGWKMKFMNGTVLQNSVETVEESIVKSEEVVIVEDEAEDVKEVVVLPASKKRKTEDKKEKKSSKKRKTGENGETGTPKKKPKKKKRKSKKALKKAKKDKTPVKEEGKSPKVKKEKTEKPKPSKSESNGAASGSSTPRNYHRAKFLAMKKASVSDKKGLKEILGVKIKREPKD